MDSNELSAVNQMVVLALISAVLAFVLLGVT